MWACGSIVIWSEASPELPQLGSALWPRDRKLMLARFPTDPEATVADVRQAFVVGIEREQVSLLGGGDTVFRKQQSRTQDLGCPHVARDVFC